VNDTSESTVEPEESRLAIKKDVFVKNGKSI